MVLDLDRARIAPNVDDSGMRGLSSAGPRWSELRNEVSVLVATDGSPDVERTARALIVEVENMNRLELVLHDQANPSPGISAAELYRAAIEQSLNARRSLADLLDLVHRRH